MLMVMVMMMMLLLFLRAVMMLPMPMLMLYRRYVESRYLCIAHGSYMRSPRLWPIMVELIMDNPSRLTTR